MCTQSNLYSKKAVHDVNSVSFAAYSVLSHHPSRIILTAQCDAIKLIIE